MESRVRIVIAMLFMVIEHFRDSGAAAVYQRAQAHGRLTPDGLRYVDSWVGANLRRCFQLMECDDLSTLMTWINRWQDLVDFEIVPVVTSGEAAAIVTPPSG